MTDIMRKMYYDLGEIQKEFLQYAPAYAQKEAQEAIWKVGQLQAQGLIRDGLYYIVLLDLVGSTDYAVRHGNDKLAARIQRFVTSSFGALNDIKIRNISLFIKEIGDAVLFVFQHFPDILSWNNAMHQRVKLFEICDEPIRFRTCINVGELFLQGANPLSLAVSQTFKMEKSVGPGEIVCTETAYQVAWPTIARAYHGFEEHSRIELQGFSSEVPLYKLVVHDSDDLVRIVREELE